MRSVYYAQSTVIDCMEMALLDALTRSYGIPLYCIFWRGQQYSRKQT